MSLIAGKDLSWYLGWPSSSLISTRLVFSPFSYTVVSTVSNELPDFILLTSTGRPWASQVNFSTMQNALPMRRRHCFAVHSLTSLALVKATPEKAYLSTTRVIPWFNFSLINGLNNNKKEKMCYTPLYPGRNLKNSPQRMQQVGSL